MLARGQHPLLQDDLLDRDWKQKYGPDSFLLGTSGSQRYSTVDARHLGERVSFKIINPGPLQLNLVHTYTNWAALDEFNHAWPELLQASLLTDYQLVVCDGCPALPLLPMPRDASLPRCNYSQRIEPVFLPVDPQAPPTYTYKGYGLHTPGCRTEPVHELLQNSCTVNATFTFMFTGDSHTRNLWSSMQAQLRGNVFLEHVWWGSWNFGNVSASYFQGKRHWLNPLIGKEDEELSELVKSDIIVMSTGQWPASSRNYGGHWATHEYVLYLKWAI
ncbi:hypothetical protein HKX48_009548, partial [Thoreauomyces humboldtii]